ncbi:MAG TPA: ABC transporter permease [Verrucomicrobiae bacterium]|jgi:lipoprotein-releasing system permease protein|nr:ABC transporter permease [Verrucomicrobiae bacterium]
MSRLPFEAFLALRYLRPRRTFVSVITVISIIGVLLGTSVLIIVIAVMSGFDQEWRTTILGFNAHLKVYAGAQDQFLTNYQALQRTIEANPDVIGVSPIVHTIVLLKTEPDDGESKLYPPHVAGVDPASIGKVSNLPIDIVAGSFDLADYGLLVGRDFATRMGLDIGSRVAIYSPNSLKKMQPEMGKTNAEAVLAEDFTIRGIFDVGFPDYNGEIIVTSLEDARELLKMPDNTAQALQIKLRDPFLAEKVQAELEKALPAGLAVYTWKQETPDIFNALAVEKQTMFFVLFFIMIVAAFGIVNCQITFVVQKTREIGILKAIGASARQILWVFLSQSLVVAVLGVGLGFGAAMLALAYRNNLLSFLRNVTHTQVLPSSIYHVYDLPASIQAGDVAVICGTAFVTCVLAGLFPAWKASRLQPVEALRHE